MANLEWDVPHTLTGPYGSLNLNVPDAITGRCYRIDFNTYKVVPSLRVTQDNISQADGSVLHPRWKTGMTAVITVQLQLMTDPGSAEYVPACQTDLREMEEDLLLLLNSIRRLTLDAQTLVWLPSGYGDTRQLTDVELLAIWEPSYDLNGLEASLSFALESPYPYATDSTVTQTSCADGIVHTITNSGNAEQSPVFQVFGPASSFNLANLTDVDSNGNPRTVIYDSSRPGASPIASGHHAEIDFFRGTVNLDGPSGTDLIAGIDPTATDFFHMLPGDNDILCTGTNAKCFSSNAWA